MEDSSLSSPTIAWSNLPPRIIEKIFNYLHPFHKPNVRLINNHWTSASNRVLFQNLEVLDSLVLIHKYLGNSDFLDNYYHDLGVIIEMLNNMSISNITQLNWDFSSLNTQILLVILEKFKFIEDISLCGLESTNFDSDRDLDKIIDKLIRLDRLNLFKIILDFSSIPIKLLNIFSKLKLKELSVECDSKYVQSLIKEIDKMPLIENLNLKVMYYSGNISGSNIVSPNQLLQNCKLKYLKLAIHDYSDPTIDKEYLSFELSKTLSNPNLSNLLSFEWFYFTHLNLPTILDKPIESNIQFFNNLTKLSLFCIDKYLMEIVVKRFNNLKELAFASPLVLPNNYDNSGLKPLTYLTKLYFKGLSIELREHHTIICNLFPNVVTLNLSFINDSTLILLKDATYIPLLFPNLTFVLFELAEFKLDRLILDYNSPLTWESLFLTIDESNIHLYNPLIKKCPNLVNLYIYDLLDIDTVIKIDNYKLNSYLVNLPLPYTWNFNYYKKLN